MSKMRYIKTNESYKSDIHDAIKLVRKKYEDNINNCLLYLIDNYEYSTGWNIDDYYKTSFKVEHSTPEELKEQLNSCIEKLEFNDMKYMDDYVIYTKRKNQYLNINVNKNELYRNIDSNEVSDLIIEIRNVK